MRAYMDGIPPEPGSGIPFFGLGADLDLNALKNAATDTGEIHEGDAEANDTEDTLAALSPDQQKFAEALIDKGADPSAPILQARERTTREQQPRRGMNCAANHTGTME